MTTEIIESWYTSLIEDLTDLIIEKTFTSRWELIDCYHRVGTRILQENDNFERAKIYGENILQGLAKSIGRSQRTLSYAVKFAKLYPDLNLLPEGKTVSWNHIINKYLTDGTEKKVVKKADLYRMIKEIRDLLETELKKELQSVNNGEIAINKSNVEFIRYLQDHVNKITGELNE